MIGGHVEFSSKYFRPIANDYSSFKGQFTVSKQTRTDLPATWSKRRFGNWIIASLNLPLHELLDDQGRLVAICLGFPQGPLTPWSGIEAFYLSTAGRWLLVHLPSETLYLDPCGSLSAVFSDTGVASSSTLLVEGLSDWDVQAISDIGFPERDTWFPFGLTAHRRVRRLLPNHCLNLRTRKVTRHWPSASTDFSPDKTPLPRVEEIVGELQGVINRITDPITLSLTAGRDSRMLLACSRSRLATTDFFTFDDGSRSVDNEVARRLASLFHLKHRFLRVIDATDDELIKWLYRTGHSASGAIWKIHKTLGGLSPDTIYLPGMAGEVGRAYLWRPKDQLRTLLTPEDLLRRCKLPVTERFLAEARKWLEPLQGLPIFVQLDLLYIEQRLGCWSAPCHLGNTHSKCEFTPFNQRSVFLAMMKLPWDYRRRQGLATDVCRIAWPDLLSLPFNNCPGVKWFPSRIKRSVKQLIKRQLNIC